MINLVVNSLSLDLFPDTSIALEFVNPAFFSDSGSIGYPFDLPATPTNRRILKTPELLELRDLKTVSYPCKLYLAGNQVADGTLHLTYPVTTKKYKVFFVVNSFVDAIENKTLRDINHLAPVTVFGFTDVQVHMRQTVELATADNFEYVFFPVATSENGVGENAWQNEPGLPSGGDFIPTIWPDVAYPYVFYLVKRIYESSGWKWLDSFFNLSAELKKLVLLNHHGCQVVDSASWIVDLKKAVQEVGIGDFLKKFNGLFRLVSFYDTVRKVVTTIPAKLLLAQTNYTDWTSKAEKDQEWSPSEDAGYKIGYNWDSKDKLHSGGLDVFLSFGWRGCVSRNAYFLWNDPAWEVNNVSDLAGISTFNRKTYWVKNEKAFYFYLTSISNWTKYSWRYKGEAVSTGSVSSPIEGDMYFITTTQLYMIYIRTTSTGTVFGWEHFSYPYIEPQVVGFGKTEMKFDIHTLEMMRYRQSAQDFTRPSHFLTDGVSLTEDEADADKMLKFLFFRGFFTTSPDNCPLGSCDIYRHDNTPIWNYSLRWAGSAGLYEKWHKDWLEFLGKTKKVIRNIRLNENDILSLDLSKMYRIENINYLIGKINVTLTMRGIQTAKAEMYTIQ